MESSNPPSAQNRTEENTTQFAIVCFLLTFAFLLGFAVWRNSSTLKSNSKEDVSSEDVMLSMQQMKSELANRPIGIQLDEKGVPSTLDGDRLEKAEALDFFLEKSLEYSEQLQVNGPKNLPLDQLMSLFEKARQKGYTRLSYHILSPEEEAETSEEPLSSDSDQESSTEPDTPEQKNPTPKEGEADLKEKENHSEKK